jgi:hypothetical protein
MDRQNPGRHLRACPLCHVAMLSERSAPDVPASDVYRCLSCGTIVEISARLPEQPEGRGDAL